MLSSTTGVEPTVTVPVTLPLTLWGAPGEGATLDLNTKSPHNNTLQTVECRALTIRETLASVSVEPRPAVAAEACGIVGAECILGALLLESRVKKAKKTIQFCFVTNMFLQLWGWEVVVLLSHLIPGTCFLILCGVLNHWERHKQKENIINSQIHTHIHRWAKKSQCLNKSFLPAFDNLSFYMCCLNTLGWLLFLGTLAQTHRKWFTLLLISLE